MYIYICIHTHTHICIYIYIYIICLFLEPPRCDSRRASGSLRADEARPSGTVAVDTLEGSI